LRCDVWIYHRAIVTLGKTKKTKLPMSDRAGTRTNSGSNAV